MFGRNKYDDFDEYNERVSARYDDDYVREEEEYRRDSIADADAHSSSGGRPEDDVLWSETVPGRRSSGGLAGCLVWGMIGFPFLIIALAGYVNYSTGNILLGRTMLIADAVCFVLLAICLMIISRPKNETYTITRSSVILKKGAKVTVVPLDRVCDIQKQINRDGKGDIIFLERTDSVISIYARDGDNKYLRIRHCMKNVTLPDKVCSRLKNAVRDHGGFLPYDKRSI